MNPIDDAPPTLASLHRQAWHLLTQGAADRQAALHLLTLTTIAADGAPAARTVVLRHTDAPARCLHIHTDTRSAKCREIAAKPRVQMLGYDPASQIQLRLTGRATLHHDDTLAGTAWATSHPGSLRVYATAIAPGTPLATLPALPHPQDGPAGRENFTLVAIHLTALEVLHLASTRHLRARITWDEAGNEAATWLAT